MIFGVSGKKHKGEDWASEPEFSFAVIESTVRRKIENLLLVCRGEWAFLAWMALLNMFLTAGSVIALSVINALLLVRFGYEVLPKAFIVSGAVLIPYFVFYSWLERAGSRKFLLIASFSGYSLLIAASRLIHSMNPADYGNLFFLYVISTIITMLVNFQYWSFANFIFHPRQGKRLFPLLGVGGTIGAMVMGFYLDNLAEIVGGSANLLYIWAGLLILSAIIVAVMHRTLDIRKQPQKDESDFIESVSENFRIINKIPILRLLSLLFFVMIFASFLIYFQFNIIVGQRFPSEDTFASFVGDFNGYLSLAVLFCQIFLTGRLVSSFGLIRSLYIHPLLVVIPVAAGILKASAFISTIWARFADILSQNTFFQTATESIYGAVPDEDRDRAMSFMKIIVTPLSIGITGIFLYGASRTYSGYAPTVASILLPFLLAIWILAIMRLKERYIETLLSNFSSSSNKKRLETFRALSNMKQSDALEILRRAFSYGSEQMKKFAIELTGEMDLKILKQEIVEFLDSDNEEIRAAAISSLGRTGGPEIYPRMMKIYKNQPPHLRILILKNLRKIAPANFTINAPLLVLENDEAKVRGLLLEHIWSKRPLLVEEEEILKRMIESDDAESRLAAAKCLRFDVRGIFTNALISLLNDKDIEVRREAIASSGKTKAQESIPALLSLLEDSSRGIADSAAAALISIKGDISVIVRGSLTFEESFEMLERKMKIIALSGKKTDEEFFFSNVCKIPPEAAISTLENLAMKYKSRSFANHIGNDVLNAFISNIRLDIRDELLAAYSLGKICQKDDKTCRILMLLLEERLRIQKKMMLLGLHFLFPEDRILTLIDNIFSGNERKKNIAVEALENLLPVEYKNHIIPVLDNESLDEEIVREASRRHYREMTPENIIKTIENKADKWLKAWCLYTAGILGVNEYRQKLETETASDDPVISEMAATGLLMFASALP